MASTSGAQIQPPGKENLEPPSGLLSQAEGHLPGQLFFTAAEQDKPRRESLFRQKPPADHTQGQNQQDHSLPTARRLMVFSEELKPQSMPSYTHRPAAGHTNARLDLQNQWSLWHQQAMHCNSLPLQTMYRPG